MQENTKNIYSINERVVQLAEHLNLTRYKIHKETGISEAVLLNIFKAKNKPSADFLVKLLKRYKVNANWLLLGEGEMFTENKEALTTLMEPENSYNSNSKSIKALKNELFQLKSTNLKLQGKIEILKELLQK